LATCKLSQNRIVNPSIRLDFERKVERKRIIRILSVDIDCDVISYRASSLGMGKIKAAYLIKSLELHKWESDITN